LLQPGYRFNWLDTYSIDPSLGLSDLDYSVVPSNDKYGQSVLIVTLENSGAREAKGSFEIECEVSIDDRIATPGDVTVSAAGSADPTPASLKVASLTTQGVTVTAETAKQLYGGLRNQSIPAMLISENGMDTLSSNRDITLQLPDWAKWAHDNIDNIVTIQVEGSNYLGVDADSVALEDEDRRLRFKIESNSTDKPGKIRIKDGKVNLAVDAQGDLVVKIAGNAGASGDVTVGMAASPSFTCINIWDPATNSITLEQ